MKKLSLDQITYISTPLIDGKSTREIVDMVGFSKSTVIKYCTAVDNVLQKSMMGRPRSLSSRDKRAIKHVLLNGEAKTAIEIKKRLNQEKGVKISSQRFRNALK